jgi:hypothetical protein
MTTLAPLQLPLYSLPDEVGSLFPLVQNGVDPGQGAGREPGRCLFVVDLFSSHLLISPIDPVIDINYIGDIRLKGKPMTTPTEAGMKILRRYIEAERNSAENIPGPRLIEAVRANGSACKAMPLAYGQGAEKAAAMKLQRQGFAFVTWRCGERLLVITDAGRAAVRG